MTYSILTTCERAVDHTPLELSLTYGPLSVCMAISFFCLIIFLSSIFSSCLSGSFLSFSVIACKKEMSRSLCMCSLWRLVAMTTPLQAVKHFLIRHVL